MPIERAYPAEASGGGGGASAAALPVGSVDLTTRTGGVSSAAEQDMFTWTLPAGTAAANTIIDIDFSGWLLNNVGSANTWKFTLYCNGVAVLASAALPSVPANAAHRRFAGRAQLAFIDSTHVMADYRSDLNSTNDVTIDATIAALGFTGEDGSIAGMDTTANQIIKLTGKWGSSLSTSSWTIHKSLFKIWTPS